MTSSEVEHRSPPPLQRSIAVGGARGSIGPSANATNRLAADVMDGATTGGWTAAVATTLSNPPQQTPQE